MIQSPAIVNGKRVSNVDEVKVIQVIQVSALRGKGESGDPYRGVTEYWSFEGVKLAEYDLWKEKS